MTSSQIDRQWLKAVAEGVQRRLLGANAIANGFDLVDVLTSTGLRAPASEMERLVALGIVTDASVRSAHCPTASFRRADMTAVLDCLRTLAADQHLSRRAVAKRLGLSESWMSHQLKTSTGRSFTEHLARVRIFRAQALLRATDLSVKAVALTVGYRDPSAFVRHFRKHLGQPPGRWRKHLLLMQRALPHGADRSC